MAATDAFGNGVHTEANRINRVLTGTPQTTKTIAQRAEVRHERAYDHLYQYLLHKKGFVVQDLAGRNVMWKLSPLGIAAWMDELPGPKVQRSNIARDDTKRGWSRSEARLLVSDYFDMLKAELIGTPYQKSEHLKLLAPQLSERSRGSIEFKHQNVSGVLVKMGLPYIEGYKPLCNFQAILAEEVEAYLEQHPAFWPQLAAAPKLNPNEYPTVDQPDLATIFEEPPDKVYVPAAAKPWLSRKAVRMDFAARDAANRTLGELAEKFVFDLERHRLIESGRDDLAQKIVWASKDWGDGLGFDIRSFDETDESERFVEVKATSLGKCFPFYVTSNEVRCSEDVPEKYYLFRVFNFGPAPRIYILRGSLRERCQLEPLVYRAGI